MSGDHLRNAALEIADEYPAIDVTAICANYSVDWPLPHTRGRPVGFFPGSTIGNLAQAEARDLLATWRRRLGADGRMIVGVDLKKAKHVLDAAYDDSAGVTEAFIRNILARANRELGVNFDLAKVCLRRSLLVERGRVEMALLSTSAQTVSVAGRSFELKAGERIHVENSHKYTVEAFRQLAGEAGFGVEQFFTDRQRLFSVWVLVAA